MLLGYNPSDMCVFKTKFLGDMYLNTVISSQLVSEAGLFCFMTQMCWPDPFCLDISACYHNN
jgi:hypothetical protein